jgi:hypothetical protein
MQPFFNWHSANYNKISYGPYGATTTWDTSYQPTASYSNGNRTGLYASDTILRGTTAKSSGTGKWFFEIIPGASSGGSIGLVNPSSPANQFPGQTAAYGFMVYQATTYGGPTVTTTITPSVAGNILGFAVDLTNLTWQLFRNGVAAGAGNFNFTGPYYPCCDPGNCGTVTLNCGQLAFQNLPAGYTAWG